MYFLLLDSSAIFEDCIYGIEIGCLQVIFPGDTFRTENMTAEACLILAHDVDLKSKNLAAEDRTFRWTGSRNYFMWTSFTTD